MQKSASRQQTIVEQLTAHRQLYVTNLARQLNVSKATIRKDLRSLEDSGLIKRVHGGAVPVRGRLMSQEVDFVTRAQAQLDEKQAIAQAAIEYIHDHDSILLDASSTCYQLANLLRNTTLQLTIVTNGIQTAGLLAENKLLRVFVVGGLLRSNNAMSGLLGTGLFSRVHVSKAFVSARGVDPEHGLTDFNLEEVELKSFMVQQVNEVIALVDHTKIGRVSVAEFCAVDRITTLITDAVASPDVTHGLSELGINIRRVASHAPTSPEVPR